MAHPDTTGTGTDTGSDTGSAGRSGGGPADGSKAPPDPVTGSRDHTTGEAQAAENERTEPVA